MEYSDYIESRDAATLDGTELLAGSKAGVAKRWTTQQIADLGGGSQNLGEVLTEGNDGGGLQIKNIADPTAAQDAATKAYTDALVTGLWDDRGNYDPTATSDYPASGGSGTAGTILKGDIWTVSVAGTISGNAVNIGDTVRALVDSPGLTDANWAIAENNIGYVPENQANKGQANGYASLDSGTKVPSAQIPLATETAVGGRELSTTSEAQVGTDDITIMTPLKATQKGRLNRTMTGATSIAQTDDQGVLFCNSASTANLTFPVLAQYTWGVIWNIGAGDINFITSSTTISGDILSLPGGTIGAVTFFYTATNQIYIAGGNSLVNALSVNGILSIKAGNSTGIIAKVGGTIHTNTTTTGNVGAGEDTLFTYSVPANTLNTDKSSIFGTCAGTFATSVNNKRLRVKFGATTIFDSGSLAITTTTDWALEFEIIRTGAATQKCNVRLNTSSASLSAYADYATAAETLSGAVTLLITGEATADNDIVGEMFKLRWEPSE